MSTLHKKQSANLGAASPRVVVDSPGSKSDQGGGVRLDVGLENITLDDTPPSVARGTAKAPGGHEIDKPSTSNGHDSQVLAQQHGDEEDHGNVPFQLGKRTDDGDVFDSPGKIHDASSSDLGRMSAMGHALAFSTATHFSTSASPSGFGSTMQGVIPNTKPVAILRNRASDLSSRAQVGGVDAQTFYPATACVFVANLPDFVRDSRLEAELTRAFSKFGIVFVKIRRDQRNMPFAFCQYTKDEDARQAVVQGRGILIEGRPCRTEMVKANRSFIIYSVLGDEVAVEEARKQMQVFGPISKCELLHPQIQAAMQIKGGVLIEYTNFDAARDVIGAYRHNPTYRVAAYDLKKTQQTPKMDPDEAWLQRYEVDRRSIYVGNLPVEEPDLERQLTQLAEEVGDVEKVQIVRKEAATGRPTPIAFGFVEFSRPDMADLAVKRLAGKVLSGSVIRVERKASKESQSIRRAQLDAPFPRVDQTPTPSGRKKVQLTPMKTTEPTTPSRAERFLPPSTSSNGSMSSTTQLHQLHRVQSQGYIPYTGQSFGSPTHYAQTPRPGANAFPATPQATPGIVSPLTPYYGTPYSWMTPYLQDPNYAPMAYFDPYSHLAPAQGLSAEEMARTPNGRGVGNLECGGDGSAQREA
ncbi:uncharacterized protein F4822DRAFT_425426 [Hypoxylon trugodes]|uniref:uncharacterized protein n=1 Tax=Hypoxylon trugodes TaxID=326681 RepID=UPI00219EEE3B|nr:uncharacterized protein F4822DRAFT_425426 [Hypoxylon trugodes]KAI1392215.1 hypothetical protein F4822DRAFT_425426 [Hypoxylon trugodes]